MRVCIVAFANLMVVPYIKTYTDILKNNNVEYDIVLWNRYKMEESYSGCNKIYAFNDNVGDTASFAKKIIPLIKYGFYVKSVLKKNKYDCVVVLTSLIGVLIEGFLKKHYSGRYIFDIRDYSYEHIKWYYKKMESLMKNSALNVISSPGFKEFLPDYPCVIDHNCSFETVSDIKFKRKDKTISVAFVGNVRYPGECKKFINLIKDDSRFEFHFYGKGVDEPELKRYCIENNFENVFFHGVYMPQEKEGIIENTDILFNAYGDRLCLKHALSNKYYESMYYKKPLIVTPNTIMSNLSKGTSFDIDYSKNTSDDIYNWYQSINVEEFDLLADDYLQNTIDENKIGRKEISKRLTSKEV